MIEKEKGIPADYLLEKIVKAIQVAVKNDSGGSEDIVVDIDPVTQKFYVAVRKLVTEEVTDPHNEIYTLDARKYNRSAEPGSYVEIPMEPKKFGRIAAQAAKHVIRQGIREGEREQILSKFRSKYNEIVSGVVLRIDPVKGNVTLEIDRNEVILPKGEQTPGEELHEGERIKVYVVDVAASAKGPKMMISRTHAGLVKRLFEQETPEIASGVVEIKAIAREAGSRTKLAVWSKDENVDAVGACIGPKGSRVSVIVEELGGEKIDVVKYSDDMAQFIAEALSPAKVLKVELDPEGGKSCKVTVPDNQLSLAIGNKGQNARLAARLTGYKIDIRPESGFYGEDEDEE